MMPPTNCYSPRPTTFETHATSVVPTMLMDATAAWRLNRANVLSTGIASAQGLHVTNCPVACSGSEGGGVAQFALHFAGGTFGGMGGIVMSYPLDTVKVRMQTTRGLYTGMIDCITKVIAFSLTTEPQGSKYTNRMFCPNLLPLKM